MTIQHLNVHIVCCLHQTLNILFNAKMDILTWDSVTTSCMVPTDVFATCIHISAQEVAHCQNQQNTEICTYYDFNIPSDQHFIGGTFFSMGKELHNSNFKF